MIDERPRLPVEEGSVTRRSPGPLGVSVPAPHDVQGHMTIARAGGDEGEGEDLTRLIHDAGAGDPEALGTLSERFRGKVTGWAQGVVKDPDDAEDVAQGVFAGLVARLAKFRGESRFATWLYRVTRNAAIDRQRTEARRASLRVVAAGELEGRTHQAAEESSPIDLAELVRVYDRELTPREREVFQLVDLEGMGTEGVAGRLGIAASTVRVLLARARRRVRAKMLERHADLIREAGYDV